MKYKRCYYVTSFKASIDAGNSVITDIPTGITETSPDPNDPTKTITIVVTHSVVVIGYQDDGNFIYIDPLVGDAQVTSESNFNKSYALEITGKK